MEGVAAGDVEGVVSVAVPAAQVVLVQLKAGPRQAGIGRHLAIGVEHAGEVAVCFPIRQQGEAVRLQAGGDVRVEAVHGQIGALAVPGVHNGPAAGGQAGVA